MTSSEPRNLDPAPTTTGALEALSEEAARAASLDTCTVSLEKRALEVICLLLIFFAIAGDPAPMVNESHYLIKAKSFWDPSWCINDPFVASGKAHATFYYTLGYFTQYCSLETTAWIGRFIGWFMIALGLSHLSWNLFRKSFLCIPLAMIWTAGIEWGNLAGEWVIGGIEGKVPAFGLVLFSLGDMVDRKWNRTWILLGGASAFHVLTGGWSVIAAMTAWWITERPREDATPLFRWPIFIGGTIALLGLGPALALESGVTAEESLRAARIYTYFRLPHHLVPSSFHPSWYLRHGLLVCLVAVLALSTHQPARFKSLKAYTATAFGFSCVGFVVGGAIRWNPDLSASLLRYYWFRLADAMVPLLFASLMVNLYQSKVRKASGFAAGIAIVCGVLLLGQAIHRNKLGIPPAASHRILGYAQNATDAEQRAAFEDWLAVCHWVRLFSPQDEIFLTPRHQQTFKWYAQRGEVVNWKDVPQNARSLIQWYERFQDLYPQRLGNTNLGSRRITIKYPKLREYRRKYGVRWMIVDRRIVGTHLPLMRVYPVGDDINHTYAVYELPTIQTEK